MTQEIQVIASQAFKDPYSAMVEDFERESGYRVVTRWLPTVEILSRVRAGEVADVIIMSTAGIADLVGAGMIMESSVQNYVQSGIGFGMQKGAVKPDISSLQAVQKTLLEAESIAYSTGPSGVYLAKLFDTLGLTATLSSKLKIIQGELVGEVVRRGEAQIGLQQIPEILAVSGIDYVGPLPPEIQHTTCFAFGLHTKNRNLPGVQAWLSTLLNDQALHHLRKYGLEPVGSNSQP